MISRSRNGMAAHECQRRLVLALQESTWLPFCNESVKGSMGVNALVFDQ
jgi:hypothetical protein